MWNLDKEGNLEETRQGLLYCAHCDDVQKIVVTFLTKRVELKERVAPGQTHSNNTSGGAGRSKRPTTAATSQRSWRR